QVNGNGVTAISDLDALGFVMFEKLPGKLPFADENSGKKMLMHVEQPAPRAYSIINTITKGVDELIAWTLQKKPDRRPQSARALKERIRTLLEDTGGSSTATLELPALKLDEARPQVTEPELPRTDPDESALLPTVMSPVLRHSAAMVRTVVNRFPRLW